MFVCYTWGALLPVARIRLRLPDRFHVSSALPGHTQPTHVVVHFVLVTVVRVAAAVAQRDQVNLRLIFPLAGIILFPPVP